MLAAAKEDRKESRPEEVADRDPVAVTDGGGTLAGRGVRHDIIGRVVSIEHKKNLGADGAIKTGYLAARDDYMIVIR